MAKGHKPDEVIHEEVTREELEGTKETKKQSLKVIKQTVHKFGLFESRKSIDTKVNAFLQQKFKEASNPMISTYIKGWFGIRYIITLHTEIVEI